MFLWGINMYNLLFNKGYDTMYMIGFSFLAILYAVSNY